jgi:hypothetical protein
MFRPMAQGSQLLAVVCANACIQLFICSLITDTVC